MLSDVVGQILNVLLGAIKRESELPNEHPNAVKPEENPRNTPYSPIIQAGYRTYVLAESPECGCAGAVSLPDYLLGRLALPATCTYRYVDDAS